MVDDEQGRTDGSSPLAAALPDAERLNEEILAGAHEGILVIDREYRYRFWNPRMEQITGVPKAQVIGRTPWDLFPFLRETGLDALLARAFDGENLVAPAFRYQVPSTNQSGWAVQKMGPLRDRHGQVTGALVFVQDITELRQREAEREQLQAQLAQAQKIDAIGGLAGGVAHDFNNLLTVILACAHEARGLTGEALLETLADIIAAGERAASLTRQLLAFSRRQLLQPLPLDLNAVVAKIGKMLRRVIGPEIELEMSLAPDLPLTLADLGQIEVVIVNLVVNARDAMPSGGRITIATASSRFDERSESADPGATQPLGLQGPCVVLSVADTGSGMDETTRLRCFEPFFTTKEVGKGTGLGLSTTYGIVRQTGGDITVESLPGNGTTFRICLPQAAGVALAEPATTQVVHEGRGETILLVDDEPMILRVIAGILSSAGYAVLPARTGTEALRVARAHDRDIDLVVTDLVMPMMDGQALVKQLKQVRPKLRVIYVSGYTHKTSDVGPAFLGKPFAVSELLETVREVLDAGPTQ